METKRKEIQEYLSENVNIFVQPMVYQIVKKRPADPAAFAAQWLKDYIAQRPPKAVPSDSDCSEQEADECPFDQAKFEKAKQKGKKKSRMGISEEVFGAFNHRGESQFRNIPKTEESRAIILSLIQTSILFSSLGDKQITTVVNAMEEKTLLKGQHVINEGDKGDSLFLVAEGEFDCFKRIDGEEKYLKTYKPGQSFGQLALMYNAPRAATIISNGQGKVFGLDRTTFSQIVKQAAIKKRELFQNVVSNVSIFSSMSSNERQQFFDVLKEQKYEAGEYVIKQGDFGNYFYIVLEGKLIAEKTDLDNPDAEPVKVFDYDEGAYFGELALLHDCKRQASVKTVSRVTLASIEREAFMRLLGSLQDILKRNQERYKTIQQEISV